MWLFLSNALMQHPRPMYHTFIWLINNLTDRYWLHALIKMHNRRIVLTRAANNTICNANCNNLNFSVDYKILKTSTKELVYKIVAHLHHLQAFEILNGSFILNR